MVSSLLVIGVALNMLDTRKRYHFSTSVMTDYNPLRGATPKTWFEYQRQHVIYKSELFEILIQIVWIINIIVYCDKCGQKAEGYTYRIRQYYLDCCKHTWLQTRRGLQASSSSTGRATVRILNWSKEGFIRCICIHVGYTAYDTTIYQTQSMLKCEPGDSQSSV